MTIGKGMGLGGGRDKSNAGRLKDGEAVNGQGRKRKRGPLHCGPSTTVGTMTDLGGAGNRKERGMFEHGEW